VHNAAYRRSCRYAAFFVADAPIGGCGHAAVTLANPGHICCTFFLTGKPIDKVNEFSV
jgi:hypothetical protein